MEKRTAACLTYAEYAKAFQGTRNKPEYVEQYKNMLLLMKNRVLSTFEGNPVDLMSIGAGTGSIENDLQDKCGLKLGNFVGIEPNAEHFKSLQKCVSTWGLQSNTLKCTIFDDQVNDINDKFDIVLMSHVLYYMDQPENVILKAKSYLKPGGKLVIFILGRGLLWEVCVELQKHVQLEGKLYVDYGDYLFSVDSVREILNRNGISFTHDVLSVIDDLTDFIERRDGGNTVINHILQTMFEKLPKDVQEILHTFVKDRCTQNGDKRWISKLDHPNAMIVVTNQ